MEKKGLTKDEVIKLIESIKFLSGLHFDGLKFSSYKCGNTYITFKNGNKEEIKIDLENLPVISDKTNEAVNVSVDNESTETSQLGGHIDTSSTNDSSDLNIDFTSSSTSSTTSFHSNKSSSTKKNMNGGYSKNMYSETSSFNPKMSKNSEVYSATSPNMPNIGNMTGGAYSETSSFNPKMSKNSEVYSATSPNMGNMTGGAYSETSSFNLKMSKNSEVYSATSPNMGNMIGGAYSETSSFNPKKMNKNNDSITSSYVPMNGGGAYSETSNFDPNMNTKQMSDAYSATSSLANLAPVTPKNIMEGGNFESDTIGSISDLKNRKVNNKLDLDIFKKASQKGGSVSNPNEIRNKMKDLGIKSTSTSSVCE